MKYFKERNLLTVICLIILKFTIIDVQAQPMVDNRIKTYVYSENKVFSLAIHYGYQSNIEFAKGEEIQTISIGDSYAWKISPVGRRLFIKPLEENVHTNMTVITNKRTYQFEVIAKSIEKKSKDLVYVVRFFYPDDKQLLDRDS